MENIKLAIKGFIIGIANVIPGVSGGTLMITLGIFEDIIHAIGHFFSDIKKNFKLLFWITLGAGLSLILMSWVITYFLDYYKLPTILFFIGLIVGGIPLLLKTTKGNYKNPANIIIFTIMFSIVMLMTFYEGGLEAVNFLNMSLFNYVVLFIVGVIAAATMVVPGLSGSFMLILLGYYEPIMETIKAFVSFQNLYTNFVILSVFGSGVLIGIILISRLIEYLLKNYEVKTYFAILGFVLSSIISIYITALNDGMDFSIVQITLALPAYLIGLFISFKLGD